MEGWMLRGCEAIVRDLQTCQQRLYGTFQIVEISRTSQFADQLYLCWAAERDTPRAAFIRQALFAICRQVAASNLEEAQTGLVALAILLHGFHQAAHQSQAQHLHIAAEWICQHDSRNGTWVERCHGR